MSKEAWTQLVDVEKDVESQCIYLHLLGPETKKMVRRTVPAPPGTAMFDFDSDGRLVGIEIIAGSGLTIK